MKTYTVKCQTCEEKPEFNSVDAFIQHLKTVHKYEGEFKFKQQMVMFMDGSMFSLSSFDCELKTEKGMLPLYFEYTVKNIKQPGQFSYNPFR